MRPAIARRDTTPPPALTRYKLREIERHLFMHQKVPVDQTKMPMVPLRITHPMKLAGEHRVIIVSEYLGTRLCRRLMWMLTLSSRQALHAPVGRHLGIAMTSSVYGRGKQPDAS